MAMRVVLLQPFSEKCPSKMASENAEMPYDEVDAEDFEVPSEDAPHCRPFFAGVDSQFVYLRALQSNRERLEAIFPSCLTHRQPTPRPFIGTRIALEDRQRLMTRSQMCAVLAHKLLCFGGVCFMKQPLMHATMVLSRCGAYSLPIAAPAWSAWLEGHQHIVWSVAFHPTQRLLATGSGDKTARLWRLSSDHGSAFCAMILSGHSDSVWSVAFHPSELLLATGSWDNVVKLWLITLESSSACCVANLTGHSDSIWSVAFHPSAPLLASGSNDNTVKIWLLSPDNLSASCVANLTEQSCSVQTVAFHPTAPLLATSSENMTLKLWR